MLNKQIPTVHSNGLNRDRLFQDKNDVTFALNAIRDNHEGGRQEYQSEPGNQLVASLPSGYFAVGSIYGQNDEIYVFSTNNTLSEIGVFRQDTYTTLANLDLGFSTEHPITGEYRVRKGCERIIYFGDGHGNDYWFNRDQPDDFKTLGVFDPNKFKFVPNILCPKIELSQVNSSGGNLPLGSYYFQAEIVDADGNSIYKTDISPQTIIYDEDQSDAYNNIDGGLNTPQYDPQIGGLPSTNKSITLTLSNLDTGFDYIRMNVVRQITGNQVIDAHVVAQLIPISSSTVQWTYTGFNTSAGDYPVDYSSLIVPDIKYKSSYVQEQVQGRYVRANVKQDQIDYSTFQSFASAISAQWVAKEVEVSDQFDLGNPKNPNTYWDCTSFQGDEIYAFAIQYLLTNGTWTPPFHIPGRPEQVSDVENILVVDNSTPGPLPSTQVWLSDAEHLGVIVGDFVPRWKVFNTASITTSNTVTHPYDYIGEFGYYESDNTTYPDIQDCDSQPIWGDDSEGNPITNITKIRHHRFPDRRLIPHITGDEGRYMQPLGVKFDNIVYPSSDVVGHRFCHAVRDENNKTVLDSGWAAQPTFAVDGTTNPIFLTEEFLDFDVATTDTYVRYNSAEIFFNKKIFSPDYIKLNTAYHSEPFLERDQITVDKNSGGDELLLSSYLYLTTQKSVTVRQNHKLIDQIFVEKGTYTSASVFGYPIQSRDKSVDDNVLRLSYDLESSTDILPAQDFVSLGDDVPVDPRKANHFYVYKKKNLQPFDDILSLEYQYLNFNFITSSVDLYNGDCIITISKPTRIYQVGNPTTYARAFSYTTFYEEHQFNTHLRHSGLNVANKYYKVNGNMAVLLDFITEIDEDGFYPIRLNQVPEFFGYNTDYSITSRDARKSPLPINFDYCSDCANEYPNRIIFSPRSFDEESFDLYRINKINDYIDLPAHRGAITGLKYQNNQLLVHTEDTTFILQPNPQQIATDQNTAYLTTGDFLSIPPQELLQTDVGTAGLQSKQSMCDTPFGHYWVDQKRGELFGWNGRLDILSNKGLLQWFKEYLPSDIRKDFFRVNRYDWELHSTLDRRGASCILHYDPRFKRLLITKKDYLPIDQREEFVIDDPLITVWDSDDKKWEALNPSNVPYEVFPDNSLLFEDKSWTLSYSFLDQSFTSWHSYIPYHAFADSNNFYTTTLSNGIYRHLHFNNYQTYFGTKYDFIIEWSNFDPVSSTVSNVYYVGNSQGWHSSFKVFKNFDTTFDRLIVYNQDQSSGLQTLILQDQHTDPYANNDYPGGSKYVVKTDQDYKIAGISDMATFHPVMTQDWLIKKLYPGYIDYVPSPLNIDLTKGVYDQGNIWDKFTFVRLFYKPVEDHRKTVILQVLNTEQSVR